MDGPSAGSGLRRSGTFTIEKPSELATGSMASRTDDSSEESQDEESAKDMQTETTIDSIDLDETLKASDFPSVNEQS